MSPKLFSIRKEAPRDSDEVLGVVRTAFDPYRVDLLVESLKTSSAWRDLGFVADSGGEVVGYIAFTRGWLDCREKLVEVLVLSPLAVAPKWQGQGIGSALVTESIAMLADRPVPLVFLEGSPGYYSRLGFRPGGDSGFTRPSARIPEPAFQFVPLASYEPWMTGALVYPDAFWEHDSVGLRDSGT